MSYFHFKTLSLAATASFLAITPLAAQTMTDEQLRAYIYQQEAAAEQARQETNYQNQIVAPALQHMQEPSTYGLENNGQLPDISVLQGILDTLEYAKERANRAGEIVSDYTDTLKRDFEQGMNSFNTDRSPQSVYDQQMPAYEQQGPTPGFRSYPSSSAGSFNVGGGYAGGGYSGGGYTGGGTAMR